MAWPEPLVALLAGPDGRAAQALRWGLHGLRASLQTAADEAPEDPGGGPLRALLSELEPLLAGGACPDAVLPSDVAADRAALPENGPRLLPLARAVVEDGRFQADLRRRPLREESDEAIWANVQHLLLRVPAYLAGEWRRRGRELAEQAGARVDESAAVALPLGRDELIYPGLTGGASAPGLRSTVSAPLDPRVSASVDADLAALAGITSACLWFVEHDPALFHCLRGVFRFGVAPLTGEQRDRYVAELLRRWERARTTAGRGEAKEALKALLDLDEALHSLVHQPPAAADSWWGRLMEPAREALLRARDRAADAGCAVHLQVLSGDFAEVNRLAPDSLQVDFGVPGEVSACLRVWARIDGEEIKGRALYRAPQGDP